MSAAAGVVSTGGLPLRLTLPLTVAVVVGEIAAPATFCVLVPQDDHPAGAASLPFTLTFPLTVVLPWVVIAPKTFICGRSSRNSAP